MTINLDADMSELQELKRQREEEVEAQEEANKEAQEVSDETDPFHPELLAILEEKGIGAIDLQNAKEKFGKVFAFPWDEQRVYVYRALYRKEWNMIREVAENPDHASYLVIKQACIYPAITHSSQLDDDIAGIQDTLNEVIMRASGFIALEEAMAAVREL